MPPSATRKLRPKTLNFSDYYQPIPPQREMHESPALWKYCEAGRRLGKSRTAFWDGMKHYAALVSTPAPAYLVPPIHFWSVVPTYKQGLQQWHEMKTFIPPELVGQILEQDWLIYLIGSELRPYALWELKSSDNPTSLQTVGLDYLHIGEAQDVSNEAWARLAPTLTSPHRLGALFAEGIPSLNRSHWFERGHAEAEEDSSGKRRYFHYTSYDNPLLEKASIDSMRSVLPGRDFRRFYLAEHVGLDSSYFGDVHACVRGDLLDGPVEGRTYVMSADLGRKVDPTILLVGDYASRQVVAYRELDHRDWNVQLEAIASTYQTWRCSRLAIDATGVGDPVQQQLRYRGLSVKPFIFTPTTRQQLYTTLAIAIEKQSIHYPYISKLLQQLEAAMPQERGARVQMVVEAEHDDYVAALALLLDILPKMIDATDWKPMPAVQKVPVPVLGGNVGTGLMRVNAPLVKAMLLERRRKRWEKKLEALST